MIDFNKMTTQQKIDYADNLEPIETEADDDCWILFLACLIVIVGFCTYLVL